MILATAGLRKNLFRSWRNEKAASSKAFRLFDPDASLHPGVKFHAQNHCSLDSALGSEDLWRRNHRLAGIFLERNGLAAKT